MSDQAQAQSTTTTTPPATPAPAPDPKAAVAAKAPVVPLDPGKDPKAPAADAKTVEPAKVEEPKIEVDGSVAKHFAELKRQREAFAAEQQRVAKEAADRVSAEAADRKELEAFKAAKAKAKERPYEAFGALGLTADDVAKALMHQEPEVSPVVAKLEQKVTELEQKLSAKDEAAKAANDAETVRQNMAASLDVIGKAIDPAKFPLTHKQGAAFVFDVLTDHCVAVQERIGRKLTREEVVERIPLAVDHCEKYFKDIAEPKQEPGAKEEAKGPKDPQKAPAKEPPEKSVVISNNTNADTPPGEPPPDPDANRKRAVRLLEERMKAKRAAMSGKASNP